MHGKAEKAILMGNVLRVWEYWILDDEHGMVWVEVQ
jgi:hypothetical protein